MVVQTTDYQEEEIFFKKCSKNLVENKNFQTFASPKDENVTEEETTVRKGKFIDKMGKH